VIVNCSWTLCVHCKNVNDIAQGKCHHPDGTDILLVENKLAVIKHDEQGSMIRCKAYYGKVE